MAKIRNLLAGILHVPYDGLRLEGFEVREIQRITPGIQRLVDNGLIEVLTQEQAENIEAPAPKPPDPPAEYEKLNEAEAIEFVEEESDPKVINTILQSEKRGAVLDALKDRLKETDNAGK